MFAPVGAAEALNRALNAAWGDSGNNLSVPLSASGRPPTLYFAGSGVVDGQMLLALREALFASSAGFALVREGDGPILEVFGVRVDGLVGLGGHFYELAERFGLHRVETPLDALLPTVTAGSLLLQAIVTPVRTVPDGQLIEVLAVPWLQIVREIQRDPEFLGRFSRQPRAFEEFLAATYDRAGFDEVTLTPRSKDGGRDVIAVRSGFGSVRILDSAKAYSPGHVVTADDVRAIFGVASLDSSSSKAAITTTSTFAPGILKEFRSVMPHRLELRDGDDLRRLVAQLLARD